MTPEELRAKHCPVTGFDFLGAEIYVCGFCGTDRDYPDEYPCDAIEALDLLAAANAEVARLRGIIDRVRRYIQNAGLDPWHIVLSVLDQKEGE